MRNIRAKANIVRMAIFGLLAFMAVGPIQAAAKEVVAERWSAERAWEWYKKQPWLVGFNFVPSYAINTTEFWAKETFDEKAIDRELGLAEGLGMNTCRVFTQYLVWKDDPTGFKKRFDAFLGLAAKHRISVMPVLFDDCNADQPEPYLGPQRDPKIQGRGMTSWTPSPGKKAVYDRTVWPDLERYVKDMVGTYGQDRRVLLWDLYNEPCGMGIGDGALVLVESAFGWARAVKPSQPLTVCMLSLTRLTGPELELSDVITFHHYGNVQQWRAAMIEFKPPPPGNAEDMLATLTHFRQFKRPVICTEWMMRTAGSRFATHLPIFKAEAVGCYSWGMVNGRIRCQWPWGPPLGATPLPDQSEWLHDLFHQDGRPYDAKENEFIRQMTADKQIWPTPKECAIEVNANSVIANISPYLAGMHTEDVNHGFYGGLYSQMIFGEAFQEPQRHQSGISGMWVSLNKGSASASFQINTNNPFKGSQSQVINFLDGKGEIGIENRGLNRWGMSFESGQEYEGVLYLRSSGSVLVYAALESGEGTTVYAETSFQTSSTNWTRYSFKLTPNGTATAGRFAIKLKERGAIDVGYAFLQPGEWGRFKGLPVRKDLADLLVAQKINFLRHGGSMVTCKKAFFSDKNLPTHYRWQDMIGLRDLRPINNEGFWYKWFSNGWGIFEFLQLCENAGIEPLVDLNLFNDTAASIADFMDYLQGPVSTLYGAKRAEDGHPAPYRLKYLQLGNENAINQVYVDKFKELATVIWSKDPKMVLVVGDFFYNGKRALPFHKQLLDFAKANNKPIYFDCHTSDLTASLEKYYDRLRVENSAGADFKVANLEHGFGPLRHDLSRALTVAHAINEREKLGDKIEISCTSNSFQADTKRDNQWDIGAIFYNAQKAWAQPAYYVTQMVQNHYMPHAVAATSSLPDSVLDVSAKKSADGKTLVLQVVNLGSKQPVCARIVLNGFVPTRPSMHVAELQSDDPQVHNTVSETQAIVPLETEVPHGFSEGKFLYTFRPNSFTILKLQ
jgi:alpha-L-arabinofuranosidase